MGKVLILAYDLNPRVGSECGLADSWLRLISKHYPAIVVTDQIHQHDIEQETYPNVEFHFIRLKPWLRKAALLFGEAMAYRWFYRLARPVLAGIVARGDIALVHCLTPNGVYAYNDVYRFGVPVLAGPVNGGLPTPPGFGPVFREQFFRTFLRDAFYGRLLGGRAWREYFLQCRKIIVSTDDVPKLLPPAARDRTEVLFDVVVDADVFRPPETKAASPEVRVLFAGVLESKKGVRLLLEAAKLCRRRGVTEFVVQIAGSGSLENRIRKWISRHGLGDGVQLLGLLSRDELVRTFQASDIFCLPTLREPGGYVILEAMACGLPVITTNSGGPAYSVTAECGIKIGLTDYTTYVHELSDALIRLIRDPAARQAMGRAARTRAVREFSGPAVEARILKIYGELLGRPGVRVP